MKWIIVCLFFLFTSTFYANAKNDDVDVDDQTTTKQSESVEVDGEVLFDVSGVSSFSPSQRAKSISNRIKIAAKNSIYSVDSIHTVQDSARIKIFINSMLIMNIYQSDAQREGIDRFVLSDLYMDKIGKSITKYRTSRNLPVLIKQFVWILVLTIAIAFALIFVNRLLIKFGLFIEKRLQIQVNVVANKSANLIKSQQFWTAFNVFLRIFRGTVIFLVSILYLNYALSLLPWTKGAANYIFGLLLNPLSKFGTSFIQYLPSLFFLIVIFYVTRYLLKLIKLFFNGIEKGIIQINNFDSNWAAPTFRIVRILLIILSIVVAYPYIPGSETNAFKGVSLFVGVLFSLGSSSFISNIIAGYTLTYRKAFQIGDRIKVNDLEGFVEEERLFVIKLRSLKNEEIIIPNSLLLNTNIINFTTQTKEKGIIVHAVVGIGYETPWRQVDAMLIEAAKRTQLIENEPEPFVLKKSLADFAVNYEINGYCKDSNLINFCYNELHQNILDVFNENNVQIMTPAYERDPEQPKIVPKDDWFTPIVKSKE